jgi:LytS/YehU family sensor histidine kinase
LLRGVLRSEGEFTTLGRELDVIEAYLDIERARFERRLRVTIDVPPGLRHVRLPALVLQPVVENAVKHGVAPRADGGDIRIAAHVEPGPNGGRLSLRIEDTGAGASPDMLRRGRESGVGLRNVERRLHGQYGSSATLSIDSTPGTGTVVEMSIPVTPNPRDESADRVAV